VPAVGERRSGASVHLLGSEYDEGPVLARREVPVRPDGHRGVAGRPGAGGRTRAAAAGGGAAGGSLRRERVPPAGG